jgi:hypothetical protein
MRSVPRQLVLGSGELVGELGRELQFSRFELLLLEAGS